MIKFYKTLLCILMLCAMQSVYAQRTPTPTLLTPLDASKPGKDPVFSGTAPAQSLVTVYVGSRVFSTNADAAGNFSVSAPSSFSEGRYTAHATATNYLWPTSANSNSATFIVDERIPAALIGCLNVNDGESTTFSTFYFNVSFDEATTGFSAAGISIVNGTLTYGPEAGINNYYSFMVQPVVANIPTVVRILPNSAFDVAGNGNMASTSYTVTYSDQVLPVELLHFSAKKKENMARLEWATASEKGNDRFEIYRSQDGKHYQRISTIKGHGTSQARKDYFHEDRTPLLGANYYRLVQLDYNGKENQIGNTFLDFSMLPRMQMSIFPNPATDRATVRFPKGAEKIELVDGSGMVLRTITLAKEQTDLQIDLTGLAKGTYYLSLSGIIGSSVGKLLKN